MRGATVNRAHGTKSTRGRILSQHCHKIRQKQSCWPATTLSRATCRGILDEATAIQQLTSVCLESTCLTSSGIWFHRKKRHHLGMRGHLLDTKLGPWYDVTRPLVLTRIRQDVLRWNMCRKDDFISTTTHFVLSPNYFRQCLHRKLAASCSHALDSGTPV